MKDKINPYKFIPIKPYFTPNEVKRIPNKIQNHIEKILLKDDEFSQERQTKYKMFFTNLNIIRLAIREGDLDYYEEDYEDYLDYFEPKLNEYSEEKLKIILKQNKAEIIGNIDELREYIKENIPSEVAEIYLWEFKARNKQNRIKFNKLTINQIKDICEIRGLNTSGRKMDLIRRILIDIDEDEIDYVINHFDVEKKIRQKLEVLESYKLKRILELKSEKIDVDGANIVNKIIIIVKLDEIDSLIEKVNNEYESYETKLKDLKPQELKLILSNEDLNTIGNQDSIIERIFENISLNELDNIIIQVNSFIEKSLKKFYDIIGNPDLKDEFKETLKEYCIKESQFNEIRKEMIDLINDYQIAEKDVESELNKLLQKKSAEIEKDTLNALYKIVGKVSLNPNFFSQLESRDLDVTDGKQIRKEMEEDIKAKKVSLDNLNSAIETKIKEAEQKKENEKFHILYEYIGESEINEQFNQRLEEDNLNQEFWLKLKNELTTLIKEKSIKKEEITLKVDELLNLEVVNNLLIESDLPTLNQIAILENIETSDDKDEQMNIIFDSISTFDKSILKNYITKINEVKNALNDFYQIQIVYILEKSGHEISGKKEEQINRVISNINIKFINSYIEKFENLKEKLNSAPVTYLFIMLNENNIKVKGAKRKIINEIIKKVHFEKINEDLKTIDQIHLKLNQLQENELIYIAESNNLSIGKVDSLANQIFTSINLNIIESNLTDVENIKEFVYDFNEIQRKHILMISHQDIPESEEEQINSILLNARLDEIKKLEERVKNAEEELNLLTVEQLNYILENNQHPPISSKEKQIDYILNNFLIEVIESNISIINKMKDELNQLSDNQLKKILNINNIEVTADRKINISRIFYEVPMEVINNNIIYVKNEVQEKTILDDIKESIVYSPRREENKKYSLTTVRKNNLNLIPVFENKRVLKDFVRNKFSDSIMNIKAIKKEFNFFKDLTLKQNNIDGIIVFRNHNIEIIKKECL